MTSPLRRELDECHRQTARLAEPGFALAQLEVLQHFQRDRLALTYADLLAQSRHAAAAEFFLAELYGGREVREREAQLERALPILERTLPERLRIALAEAFRLQSLSLELDIALAETMAGQGIDTLTPGRYIRLYPSVSRSAREEQIELIYHLAHELDRAVRLPLVPALIRAMRQPARMAGFANLQSFLEHGLGAFRAMRGAEVFSSTIRDRELRIMESVYAIADTGIAAEDFDPADILMGRA